MHKLDFPFRSERRFVGRRNRKTKKRPAISAVIQVVLTKERCADIFFLHSSRILWEYRSRRYDVNENVLKTEKT